MFPRARVSFIFVHLRSQKFTCVIGCSLRSQRNDLGGGPAAAQQHTAAYQVKKQCYAVRDDEIEF